MVGSPFGVIAPSVFFNSSYQTIISNTIRNNLFSSNQKTESTEDFSLFIVDQTCMPGCEGGPAFDYNSNLIGVSNKR